MRSLAIAIAALAPLVARGQHQGMSMPMSGQHQGMTMPGKATAKKQAAKTTARKGAAKKTAKSATKAKTSSAKKGASGQKPMPHHGHGAMPTKGAGGKEAAPAAQPQGHQGHGGAVPPKTPSGEHQGHVGAAVAPDKGATPTQPTQHEGHGGSVPTEAPVTPPAGQEHQGHGGTAPAGQVAGGGFQLPPPGTQPNMNKEGWPKPVMDTETYSLNLFERLEYLPSGGGGGLAWDFVGWRGGDYRRLWYKTEGDQGFQSGGSGEGDVEIHYGRLVAPFFDLLTGVRVEQQWGDRSRTRFSVGVGLQGLSPYLFDTEAFVFLSQTGRLSFNGTFARDVYQAQRLIFQPRVEVNASLQSDRDFGVGSGLNDLELSLRLRYEIRREFAPYLGITWQQQFGQTASLSRGRGEDTSRFRLVFGVRLWF